MINIRAHEAGSVRVIRVFLASPGDLNVERRAAREAVDEVNRTVARPAGFQIDLVGWEDTLSSVGRPQSVINKDLDSCQVFIGLIWQRWGTPPDLEGLYTSGFEEEYQRSRERLKKNNVPFMRLFFKDVDPSKLEDVGPELQKVLDFKKRVIEEKSILFQTFDNVSTFAKYVRLGLSEYINDIIDAERSAEPATIQAASVQSNVAVVPVDRAVDSSDEAKLLVEIAERISATEEAIDKVTIARLRNLAAVIGETGNDEVSLGVHDANLIFAARGSLHLSGREKSGLVDAGLDLLDDEVAPLWSWLADRLDSAPMWLMYSSVVGPKNRRANALKVMLMLEAPLPAEFDPFSREEVFAWWFDETSDSLRNAALEYLKAVGVTGDLAVVRKELDKDNYGTRDAAQKSVLGILLRNDFAAAISFIIKEKMLPVDATFERSLVGLIKQLGNEDLHNALAAQAARVRLAALKCLSEREALKPETLRVLLEDVSIDVRDTAFRLLEATGITFTIEEASAILVRKISTTGLGGTSAEIEEGRAALEAFAMRRRVALPQRELEEQWKNTPFNSDKFFFALGYKNPKKLIIKMRENFDDRFEGFMEEYAGLIRLKYADKGSREVMDDLIRDSRKSWIRGWMRSALDFLSENGNSGDLERVRLALDEDAVDPRKADITIFKRFGSFEDISRVIKIENDYRSAGGKTSILGSFSNKRDAARAIIRLAKDSMVDLLAIDVPAAFIPTIIAEIKAPAFKKIGAAQLEKLLYHTSDDVRKAAALKLLVVEGSRSIRGRLDKYISADRNRFYNVCFWLDLSGSLPHDQVRRLASTELARFE